MLAPMFIFAARCHSEPPVSSKSATAYCGGPPKPVQVAAFSSRLPARPDSDLDKRLRIVYMWIRLVGRIALLIDNRIEKHRAEERAAWQIVMFVTVFAGCH